MRRKSRKTVDHDKRARISRVSSSGTSVQESIEFAEECAQNFDQFAAQIGELRRPYSIGALWFEFLLLLYLVTHVFLQNFNVYRLVSFAPRAACCFLLTSLSFSPPLLARSRLRSLFSCLSLCGVGSKGKRKRHGSRGGKKDSV